MWVKLQFLTKQAELGKIIGLHSKITIYFPFSVNSLTKMSHFVFCDAFSLIFPKCQRKHRNPALLTISCAFFRQQSLRWRVGPPDESRRLSHDQSDRQGCFWRSPTREAQVKPKSLCHEAPFEIRNGKTTLICKQVFWTFVNFFLKETSKKTFKQSILTKCHEFSWKLGNSTIGRLRKNVKKSLM